MAEGFDNGVSVLRRAGTEPRLLVCAHVVDGHAAQALAIGNPSRRRHKTVAVADPMLDLLVGGRLLVHQHTFGSSPGRHSRSSCRSITHRPPCWTQCPGRRLSVALVRLSLPRRQRRVRNGCAAGRDGANCRPRFAETANARRAGQRGDRCDHASRRRSGPRTLEAGCAAPNGTGR